MRNVRLLHHTRKLNTEVDRLVEYLESHPHLSDLVTGYVVGVRCTIMHSEIAASDVMRPHL